MVRLAWTLVILLGVAAVAPAQDPDDALRQRAAALRATLVEMTDLQFKAVPGVGAYSKDELRGFLVRDLKLGLPPREAKKWERIGYQFGFWGRDFDLMKTYVEMLTESIAGFYHPRTKELKVVRGKDEQSEQEKLLERMLNVKMADVYMLHELFHAAQDQHFDLMRYKAHDIKNDDLSIGLETLIEGEASLVHYRYMLKNQYDMVKRQFMEMPADPPGDHPRYLFKTLYFPYSFGWRFVDEAVTARGWKVATKMFDDPPLSTEMVLHPNKWIDKERDYPTDMVLRFAKISAALGDAWERLEDNVHGEYVIRLMFEEFDMAAEGIRAAAGWDGDRYAVYHRAKDDRLMSLWISTWDTEKDAEEFVKAYTALLARKYEGWEKDGGQAGVATYRTRDRGKVRIERRGADVLILEGVDDAGLKVADPIWDTLRKEEIRKFVPQLVRYI